MTVPAAVTLKGGYGCDFTPTPMPTAIIGSLAVSGGSVIIDGMVIP
jgi:hypothetical protein